MEITTLPKNSETLSHELAWLTSVLDTRMKLYFSNSDGIYKDTDEIEAPVLEADPSPYARYLQQHALTREERLAMILALAPHLKPELLDVFFTRNALYDRSFSEFGGKSGKSANGFIPSGETLLFVLAGNDLTKRIRLTHFFLHESFLVQQHVLTLSAVESGEPVMSGLLSIDPGQRSFLIFGKEEQLSFHENFPATLIRTDLEWSDLVLDQHVKEEVEEIKTWIRWSHELQTDATLKNRIKPGYRCLFYGPPGTGKTLTVSLLGKATGKEVYKVDLSVIVSENRSETDKTLTSVFDAAQTKNGILFFDEAEALFGKRTASSSSNDRYANRQAAYLLQRMEDFPGLIILATNVRINLDDAFTRRFQSMIHFSIPGVKERTQLWENAFRHYTKTDQSPDLKKIAEDYDLTGGSIINVLLYCLLYEKSTGKSMSEHTLLEGIKRELRKKGRPSELHIEE